MAGISLTLVVRSRVFDPAVDRGAIRQQLIDLGLSVPCLAQNLHAVLAELGRRTSTRGACRTTICSAAACCGSCLRSGGLSARRSRCPSDADLPAGCRACDRASPARRGGRKFLSIRRWFWPCSAVGADLEVIVHVWRSAPARWRSAGRFSVRAGRWHRKTRMPGRWCWRKCRSSRPWSGSAWPAGRAAAGSPVSPSGGSKVFRYMCSSSTNLTRFSNIGISIALPSPVCARAVERHHDHLHRDQCRRPCRRPPSAHSAARRWRGGAARPCRRRPG